MYTGAPYKQEVLFSECCHYIITLNPTSNDNAPILMSWERRSYLFVDLTLRPTLTQGKSNCSGSI